MSVSRNEQIRIRDAVLTDLMDTFEKYYLSGYLENTYTEDLMMYLEDNYAFEEDCWEHLVIETSKVLGVDPDTAEDIVIENKLYEKLFSDINFGKLFGDIVAAYA